MKKKSFWIILIASFFIMMPNVFAAGYYYQTLDENFMLCESENGDCVKVSKGQNGVRFNLSSEQIIYNNNIYVYNDEQQQSYNKSQNGISTMYYYVDHSNRYILCKSESDCNAYSFDSLSERGATISAGSYISTDENTTYYYSQSKQDEYNQKMNYNATTNTNDSNEEKTSEINKPYTESEACTRLKEPLTFIGNIVLVVKIVIPIIIIIIGTFDFFKAVTGAKDDEIRKSAKSFAIRLGSGVVIFLLPTVVSIVFSLISSWGNLKGEFNACQKCILNVRECR